MTLIRLRHHMTTMRRYCCRGGGGSSFARVFGTQSTAVSTFSVPSLHGRGADECERRFTTVPYRFNTTTTAATAANDVGNSDDMSVAATVVDATTAIPGMFSHYGSLQDVGARRKSIAATANAAMTDDRSVLQHVTHEAIIDELIHQQTATIEKVVPWFLDNMPESYFSQVPEQFRMDHMKAIAAVQDANMDLYLNLQAHVPDGRKVLTFIRPGTKAGTLLQMVQELPEKYSSTPLSRLHVFSSADQSMSLNLFVYGKPPRGGPLPLEQVRQLGRAILDHASSMAATVDADADAAAPDLDALLHYMSHCTETYLRIGSHHPARFLQQVTLVQTVAGTEGTALHISRADDHSDSHDNAMERRPPQYWVDMAVDNSMSQVVLENMCRLLYTHEFDVIRARLDIIPWQAANKNAAANESESPSVAAPTSVTMLRTLVEPIPGAEGQLEETFSILAHELKRAKWLDPATYELVFDRFPFLGVTRAEIITGLCAALHPVLAKVNALAYSNASIYERVLSNPRFIGHAAAIADVFLDRFRPTGAVPTRGQHSHSSPMSNDDFMVRCAEICQSIESDVEDSMASTVLLNMVDMVQHTLKTNVYMPDRYALSFRFDPVCMMAPDTIDQTKELPFGILFVHGRRFNGFHVRFRDIARGGMRLVTPASAEQYALESARQYDECYGLAFAQQLKNKDIPEGGSKAVILINTHQQGLTDASKFFIMRKSVKAMTDAILDLIVDTDYTRKYLVDLWGKKEVLYLGPDEQVLPEDIEWIVKRAGERGYDTPAAFMSSKPRAGINHKEYGVTSEGVNVYLDVALRKVLNIDPTKDKFTVKITGGPDGDVAGNEIKILIREYGDNVIFLGIADHSGCTEDPNGLDHAELMRLFQSGLCIAHFDPSKLSNDGAIHRVGTPEGVKARNSMHNRLKADAFLPCGGRPNTIDMTNYKHFLQTDGTASAPLIVEGANLFITTEAREALFREAGVAIVKDSSANKGGVITSSYEICAAMLLTEEEFFDNKEQIVSEVLEKLRGLAKLEATLLFREFDDYDGASLPEVSQIISNCINVTTDALANALDTMPQDAHRELLPLFRVHLPKTIADMSFELVHEKVPPQYVKNAIASCLASKMVYKEGTKFISSQPKAKLASMALKYVAKEKEVARLMETLDASDLPDAEKETIRNILDQGGARTSLNML